MIYTSQNKFISMSSSKLNETCFTGMIKRTDDVMSFRIKKPENFQYEAGQFMFIKFRSSFGEKRKHLTISSSPTEPFLEVTKRLTGSDFCKALLEKKPDDKVLLEGPYGDFVAETDINRIGMICGGIGITPLRSMIRFYADKKYSNNIILIYSNKTRDGIVFKNELDALMKKEAFNFKALYTLTEPEEDWSGERGRVEEKMVKRLVPDFMSRVFYTSGPPAMVDAMHDLLRNIGVDEDSIRLEHFPGYSAHPEINVIDTQ